MYNMMLCYSRARLRILESLEMTKVASLKFPYSHDLVLSASFVCSQHQRIVSCYDLI